jgi:hypothetical protein
LYVGKVVSLYISWFANGGYRSLRGNKMSQVVGSAADRHENLYDFVVLPEGDFFRVPAACGCTLEGYVGLVPLPSGDSVLVGLCRCGRGAYGFMTPFELDRVLRLPEVKGRFGGIALRGPEILEIDAVAGYIFRRILPGV